MLWYMVTILSKLKTQQYMFDNYLWYILHIISIHILLVRNLPEYLVKVSYIITAIWKVIQRIHLPKLDSTAYNTVSMWRQGNFNHTRYLGRSLYGRILSPNELSWIFVYLGKLIVLGRCLSCGGNQQQHTRIESPAKRKRGCPTFRSGIWFGAKILSYLPAIQRFIPWDMSVNIIRCFQGWPHQEAWPLTDVSIIVFIILSWPRIMKLSRWRWFE